MKKNKFYLLKIVTLSRMLLYQSKPLRVSD